VNLTAQIGTDSRRVCKIANTTLPIRFPRQATKTRTRTRQDRITKILKSHNRLDKTEPPKLRARRVTKTLNKITTQGKSSRTFPISFKICLTRLDAFKSFRGAWLCNRGRFYVIATISLVYMHKNPKTRVKTFADAQTSVWSTVGSSQLLAFTVHIALFIYCGLGNLVSALQISPQLLMKLCSTSPPCTWSSSFSIIS